MSKLAKKFLLSISAVLVVVVFISVVVNSQFIGRYYIYERKAEMNEICDTLMKNADALDEAITTVEETRDVVIARVDNTSDINVLNERLRSAFLDKGLGLDRYWLWDQDYLNTMANGRQLRIYNQAKLHYSILVEYLNLNETFVGVAIIIPNISEIVTLINGITLCIFLAAVIIMMILIYFLVKKITTPLSGITALTKDISNQKFSQIEIKTNDELEDLACSINDMSLKLKESQEALLEKNRQMEALLGNVSHDLKTPVALIKAYTCGMKDGIDDGTFLDTVIRQNEKMERLIEGLLDLSRIRQKEYPKEPVAVSRILTEMTDEYQLELENRQITLKADILPDAIISASPEGITAIISNLISNAVKYTCDRHIKIRLYEECSRYVFEIANGVAPDHNILLERIWDPFYVAEKSRNKELSGTGLGLSIVSAAAQKQGFAYNCRIQDGEITFTIRF